ncbi:MAG: PQQ-binding-like beta-propeller repeat protein [Acidobacteria bacterium]|nr:PQQ-binding-like beta-propeller repeat protein [Acidobacteriota bacterium]
MGTPAPCRVFRPRLALAVAAVLALASACLYLPPVRHTAGDSALKRAQAEATSRDAMRNEIGRADVLRTRAIWVHDWLQSYGYIVAGYSGAELTGKPHRVLVRFDGDSVARMEIAAPPPLASPPPRKVLSGPCEPDDSRRLTIALAAAGGTIAALDTEGSICVWTEPFGSGRVAEPRLGRGRSLFTPDGAVAVSPDGALVGAARDRSVAVWEIEGDGGPARATRPRVWSVKRPKRVLAAAFSPDGKQLAVAGTDGLVVIECASGREAWPAVKAPRVEAVAFTTDGARLVASDSTGRLLDYDAATGRLLGEVEKRNVLVPGLEPLAAPPGRLPARSMLVAGRAGLETGDLEALERERGAADAPRPISVLDDAEVAALRDARLFPLAALPPRFDPHWGIAAACGRSVALSPDGTRLAEQLGAEVRVFRLPDLALIAAWDSAPPPPEEPAAPLPAAEPVTDGDAPSTPVPEPRRRPRPGPVAWTREGELIQVIGAELVAWELPPPGS